MFNLCYRKLFSLNLRSSNASVLTRNLPLRFSTVSNKNTNDILKSTFTFQQRYVQQSHLVFRCSFLIKNDDGVNFLRRYSYPVRSFSTDVKSKEDEKIKTVDAKNEAERAKKRRILFSAGAVLSCSLIGVGVYIYVNGRSKYDEQGNLIIDQFSDLSYFPQIFKRAYHAFWTDVEAIKEPSRDVLLPDPISPPYYQPKYTVVLELNGILVCPDWTFSTGWRFKKRQGVDYFLKALSYPVTELVIYTSESGMTANAIVDNLDTEQAIIYRLYRDCTKYEDGGHIKVLSKLNRDLSKVIFVDWDNVGFKYNPENALRVKKWEGDDDDMDLIHLANLIRTIVELDVPDVRPVLKYYSSSDDPIKFFLENAKKLKEKEESMKTDDKSKTLVGKWSRFSRH